MSNNFRKITARCKCLNPSLISTVEHGLDTLLLTYAFGGLFQCCSRKIRAWICTSKKERLCDLKITPQDSSLKRMRNSVGIPPNHSTMNKGVIIQEKGGDFETVVISTHGPAAEVHSAKRHQCNVCTLFLEQERR